MPPSYSCSSCAATSYRHVIARDLRGSCVQAVCTPALDERLCLLTSRIGRCRQQNTHRLIESASVKPPHQVAITGDMAKPVQTGQPNAPAPVAKTTRVIRVADFSTKTYHETEADVNACVAKLKAELLAAIRAG